MYIRKEAQFLIFRKKTNVNYYFQNILQRYSFFICLKIIIFGIIFKIYFKNSFNNCTSKAILV